MTREKLEAILFGGQVVEVIPEEEEGVVNALMPGGETSLGGQVAVGRTGKKLKKKEKEGRNTVRRILVSGVAEYGSQLIEEIIRSSGVEGNTLVKDIGSESNPPASTPPFHMVLLPPFPRMLKDLLC